MLHLKRGLRMALTSRPVQAVLAPLMAGRATIFMLHRFSDAHVGRVGHDPTRLETALSYLRREGYELIALHDLLKRMRDGRGLDRAVVFTMDDGYAEQIRVAGPVFAAFDCPVTTFVTTGFLDGTLWFWWDRIEYVLFVHSKRPTVSADIGNQRVAYDLRDREHRSAAVADFVARCKTLTASDRDETIRALAVAADVELPARPPQQYAPPTWDELRAQESHGMSFGPHTVTHPILSMTSDRESRDEIAESWTRVRAELRQPVPIFCYPNGQLGDYGSREFAALRDLEFDGAVVGTPGYAEAARFHAGPDAPFQLPRVSYPDDLHVALQCVSGLDHLLARARGMTGRSA